MVALDQTHHKDEQLSAYIDGELTPQERQDVEKHLDGCPQCRAEFAQLRQVAELASESLRSVRCISAADRAAFIHGKLDAAQHREIQDHLGRCKRCREEIEQLRQWVQETPEAPAPRDTGVHSAAPAARQLGSVKARRRMANYVAVFVPLAAAAAIVVAFTSMLTGSSGGPAIQAMNVRTTATRDTQQNGALSVAFGSGCTLHTNDEVQFVLQTGSLKYAAIFVVTAGGVSGEATGPLGDTLTLPATGKWWRLRSGTGTDAVLVAFAREPFSGEQIESARKALAGRGPLPVLPYGSVLWLDKNGHWASEKPIASTAEFDALAATLKQTLSSNAICRGAAFAHE